MTSARPIAAAILALSLIAGPMSLSAQTTPPPATSPAATSPAPTNVPAIVPAEYANNPEYMLAIDLSTGGRVVVQLRPDAAPQHVERVKQLARQGFYDGLLFHRVIEGFMAQGGDPLGNGTGGSTLADLTAEFNTLPHVRGAMSMARSESPNSANSQFFIVLLPRLSLDRNYTVFGRVVSGMEFVDRIQRGEPPANPSRIVQMSVLADNRPMPPASALTETRPAEAAVSLDDLNSPLNQ